MPTRVLTPGLLAGIRPVPEDVENVLPNAVQGGEGEKSISFNDIVAHLTKAVQELSARVTFLEVELQAKV